MTDFAAQFERGATPFYACQYDQRFSYCLYVPKDETPQSVLVLVHGTLREAQTYRDAFAAFGEAHNCLIVAPMFPAGIQEFGELDNYKLVKFREIRYDLVLLGMLEEIGQRYEVGVDRFCLYGFSGGAQFAHRFYLLHPERLRAVSIAAPGSVTLLDETKPWWVGTRDLLGQFGRLPNVPVMRKTQVQMLIGGEDRAEWRLPDNDPRATAGADDAGVTRRARLESLRDSYEAQGIAVRFEVAPGVGHDGDALLPLAALFFGGVLKGQS